MAPPDLSTSSAGNIGTPAGYGRACTACQRAKCKCILRSSGQDCERCFRLGKQCQPMTTARKRVTKKSSSSRTAQLEEKLEDLVTILRAAQPSNGHLQHSNAAEANSLLSSHSTDHITSRLDSLATAAASSFSSSETQHRSYAMPHDCGSRNAVDSHTHTPASSHSEDTSALPEPTPQEAEGYLDKFREWLKHFPCVVLPQDTTAESLRKEKPFLWLCLMNITSMSVDQQMKMKDRVRQEVATRIIVNHERSMDVLQGLICYISWASTTSHGKPFLVTFCQMAVLLTYDLGLTKAPAEEQYFMICFKMWGGRPPPPRLRTVEERRAIVSLWFLTSVMSSFLGKMDPLQWTPHMGDCLDSLERDKDCPSDEILVAFVRYQHVADEAQKLLVRDVMGESSPAPTYIFRKSLLSKLQAVRDGLPLNMPLNPVLQAHSLATEVQVNSVGLFMQNIPVNQRIESMYFCLKAIRSWFDVFFSIPVEKVPGAPFALFIQLSQIQIALYRLTTSEDPAWDKDTVRNTADLLLLLDQVIDFFMRLDSAYKMRTKAGEETVFIKGANIMRNVRNSWEPTLSRHLGATSSTSTNRGVGQSMVATNPVHDSIDMANVNMMDFGDITWMSDVFGPWDF
ncbi:hypothetical protein F66182_1623 [Fusarium sp. NRRL 66182]|nr:hypothetical protein F66182_1623 [Fusarium sp. NRRL 66182]